MTGTRVPRDPNITPEMRRFLDDLSRVSNIFNGMTAAEATAALDVFTNTLKGLAPASGGGTTNFLRADGSWAVPVTPIDDEATAKAWAKFVANGADGAATMNASYNVTGVNKDGTGDYTVTLATDFSSADYAVVMTPLTTGSVTHTLAVVTQAAGSFTIKAQESGTDDNPEFIYFVCYGAQ